MSLSVPFSIGHMLRGRWVGVAMIATGAVLILSLASVPLTDKDQAILGAATIALFIVANRRSGRAMTLALVVLSCAVSLRYFFWRVFDTMQFHGVLQGFLGVGLALAELYAIIVLAFGYIQTAWPLERKPVPLPDRVDTWPSVDIFIPTYNESLSVVRSTVLAALAIDYPPDRMNVYICDDGRRGEFKDFADACGAGYIIRADNSHAKAGNLNHAMSHTNGEYVVIFDCDHIPTRAFLQMTLGWLVRDPKLCMVQTPHHFYSPDPFQRNLTAGKRVPAEGNMFYGLVQDGNDFWDAAFFCGSCAVLRRSAIESIGGFAVETVTEDAHTALRMQRKGWRTAYLKMPLAAGLATERLSLHIGQRMRWARGMLQIFRIDNPLFGPGLRLPQRLCYANAMMHFMFAIPRLVFLSSPIAYLLLNQNLIAASPLAIIAYAGPHIFHAVATNSRIQGSNRHSFWSEIYETVMALFLVRLTIVTLMSPRRGKFNVTDKGGLLTSGYFDMRAVYPNMVLGGVLGVTWLIGVGRLLFTHPDQLAMQALLLNTIWLTLSLLVIAAALAVGRETRQVRRQARVRAILPATIYLPDGRAVIAETRDLSMGGAQLSVQRPDSVADDAAMQIEVRIGVEAVVLPAEMRRWQDGLLQVAFTPDTIADESRIVQAVFGRADAWLDWDRFPKDRVWVSLWTVLQSIAGLFRSDDAPASTGPAKEAPLTGAVPIRLVSPEKLEKQTMVVRPRRGVLRKVARASIAVTAATAATLLLVGFWNGANAQPAVSPQGPVVRLIPGIDPAPQAPQSAPRSVPQSVPQQPMPAVASGGAILPPPPDLPPASPGPAVSSASGSLPPSTTGGVSAPQQAAVTAQGGAFQGGATQPALPSGPGTRRVVLTLGQLGASGPMTMRGTSELQGVLFGVRADEVVIGADLALSGAMSPALIPESSNVTITLNEQYVGTVPVDRDHPVFGPLPMSVNPVFFQEDNRLNFRFTGRYTNDCNDPMSGLLWATVSDTSSLTLTLARLPAQHNLARLPLPFFDRRVGQALVLPFVMPPVSGSTTLQAAGIVSSWFGSLAGFRGARFPVSATPPAEGNAVMFVVGQERPAGVALPSFGGPTLAVVANPNDAYGSILVVGGRDEAEVAAAAAALAVGDRLLGGATATVRAPDVPPRRPYDAPAWMPTDRPVKFGELTDPQQLQGSGYSPGAFRVPFNTAPDLYTWRHRPFPVDLHFRAPPGPVVDLAASHLDVLVNGQYLRSIPLAQPEPTWAWMARAVGIDPVIQDQGVDIPPYAVFGMNQLQLAFDARPLHRGDCVAIPGDIHMSVDPDSTIDLSGAYRFTQLPNLAFLVNSGFPFTRMADLSETGVIMPDRPGPPEISAFLGLMGMIGSLTGYPVLRVVVVRPDEVDQVADRDLIQIGTLTHLGAGADLLRNGPVRLDGDRLSVNLSTPLSSVRRWLGDPRFAERDRLAGSLVPRPGPDTAMLIGVASPLHAGRSLVSFLAVTPQGLTELVDSLRDNKLVPQIQGDFALLAGGRFTSYRVQTSYTVGSLPFWMWPEWMLGDRPFSMIALLVLASVLGSVGLYWALRRVAARRVLRTTRRA